MRQGAKATGEAEERGRLLGLIKRIPNSDEGKGGHTMTGSLLAQSLASVGLSINWQLVRNADQSLLLWNSEVCDLTALQVILTHTKVGEVLPENANDRR